MGAAVWAVARAAAARGGERGARVGSAGRQRWQAAAASCGGGVLGAALVVSRAVLEYFTREECACYGSTGPTAERVALNGSEPWEWRGELEALRSAPTAREGEVARREGIARPALRSLVHGVRLSGGRRLRRNCAWHASRCPRALSSSRALVLTPRSKKSEPPDVETNPDASLSSVAQVSMPAGIASFSQVRFSHHFDQNLHCKLGEQMAYRCLAYLHSGFLEH